MEHDRLLSEAARKAINYLDASRKNAADAHRICQSYLRDFEKWCKKNQLAIVPSSIANYADHMARMTGLTTANISRRISAINLSLKLLHPADSTKRIELLMHGWQRAAHPSNTETNNLTDAQRIYSKIALADAPELSTKVAPNRADQRRISQNQPSIGLAYARNTIKTIKELTAKLEAERGMHFISDGVFSWESRPELTNAIKQLMSGWIPKIRAPKPISSQAVEVMAIIAMKQPVNISQINAIRGVNSFGALHTLFNRKLIDNHRCSSDPKTKCWITTQVFLKTYKLTSIEDLYEDGRLEEVFPSLYEDAEE